MTHSIPDSCAVALQTELGTVLVTGDYKFDQTPVDGPPADVSRLAELGREGLLLLLGDSTNANRPGFSPSERIVGPQLERVFADATGRIIVTSFASNIHRVQQVVDAAETLGRKVALVGRSMRKNVGIGRSLGHIAIPEGMVIGAHEVEDWPDEKVVVISTGSQGEPLSALRRMAYNDHPQVKLRAGDTVVFSATPIPGNERAVGETVDRLYQLGCHVVTTAEAMIHASGHGHQEELKLMLNLVKPRYVLPVHGDYKRLYLHAELANSVGVAPDRVFRGQNGLPLEIDHAGARFGEPERSGMVFVDGVDIGDPADVALRDRRMLSADGDLHRRGDDLGTDRRVRRASGGDLPRRALCRPGRWAGGRDPRGGRSFAPRGRERRRPRNRPASAGAPRGPGRVRLRATAPQADGAARGG